MRKTTNHLSKILVVAALAVIALSSLTAATDSSDRREPEVYVTIGAEPNFVRFSNRDSITWYLEKVTPEPLGRDWDYLQYFIDECHRLGMRLSASFSIMPCGSPYWQRGLASSTKLNPD